MTKLLRASKNPVQINATAGKTVGKTKINYENYKQNAEFHFFLDINNTGYKAVILNPLELAAKEFDVSIHLGEIITVSIFVGKLGEPLIEAGPREKLTIVCVSDRKSELLAGEDSIDAGGTYLRWKIPTKGFTSVWLQVGEDMPFLDSSGTLMLKDPDFTEVSAVKLFHDVEVSPLLAGHLQMAVALIVDPQGNWQSLSRPFATKPRSVRIEIRDINITNCGDSEVGEGFFQAEVLEFGNQSGRLLDFRDIHLNVKTGENISLKKDLGIDWSFVLTPRKITREENYSIAVCAYGIEYDDVGVDEIAYSHPSKRLILPFGRDNETVINKFETVTAQNKTGGVTPFQFDLVFSYNVTYL